MANDKQRYLKEIQLSGRLITHDDPAAIGENFQTLKNLRYESDHLRGVGGMTKINSSVMNSTYYKARRAIHFAKSQPTESHVVVEALNDGETASAILQNTTAIPDTGNFEADALYTPTSGTNPGHFSLAPNGAMAYANGEEVCVWGGNEYEVGGFINYDPGGSFSYDYTERVRNTKTDTKNKAVLNSTGAGIDSNTMLLLHLDDNVTDSSPTTPHTVTNNSVTFSNTEYVFGTHSAVFSGSAYLSVPDDADFDFSSGTWTVDCRIRLDDLSVNRPIYYQKTDAERYFYIYINTNGNVTLKIYNSPTTEWTASTAFSVGDAVIPTTPNDYFYECTDAGTSGDTEPTWPTTVGDTVNDGSVTWTCRKVVDFSLATSAVISAKRWYHVEIAEDGDNYYIFVDGYLKKTTSSTDRAINYSGAVWIGYDGSNHWDGYIDEYRVSDVVRHTESFEVSTEAYSDSSTAIYLYVGSVMPLQEFKFYIGTVNTSASSMSVYYWDGSSWTSVDNLSDGTASGGKSLAQTGSVTFDTTVSIAKLKYINGIVLYWYKVVVDKISANTSITYVTVNFPFQELKDIWDGVPREVTSFQVYKSSTYHDYTINVREDNYSSADSGTYAGLGGLEASNYFVAGFSDRLIGINFNFVGDKVNTRANTILSVYYWDGSSWTSVGDITDGTSEGGVSFAKNGAVTWSPISFQNEFTKEINNSTQLYYYKFQFSEELSASVHLYYVTGIAAQKEIGAYKFPMLAHNRLWLCCDAKDRKNKVICSSEGTLVAFNGEDSVEYEFGDDSEITGAAWLYSQYGSSLYNVTIFFKRNEMWALIGDDPETWIKYRISGIIGCVAPETIKVVDLEPDVVPTLSRCVVIWQGADGIYLSDGRTPTRISDDIKDIFDVRSSTVINQSKIGDSTADWDGYNQEYHFYYASGSSTTLDKELVFSFRKKAWFEIDRTSDKRIQVSTQVKDTNGNTYNYGFIDTGYMERLEYGNDFDGQNITHTFQFGDIAPADGSIMTETSINHQALVAVAKTNTTNDITITHYGDSALSGTSFTVSPNKSGYRLIFPVEHKGQGAHVFHSWKVETTTDNETVGFEPLYFGILYTRQRDHTRDWRA